MRWLLRFSSRELETAYLQQLHSGQARLDMTLCVLGVLCLTVMAKHALQAGSPHLVPQALAGIVCMALPLLVMLSSRQLYASQRHFWLLIWLPATWHFACRGGAMYHSAGAGAMQLQQPGMALPVQQAAGQQAAVAVRWWRQAQPGSSGGAGSGGAGSLLSGIDLRALPSQLFVRTEIVPLIMANVGVRQVFRRHALLHIVCLSVVAEFNCRRCQALTAELPVLAAPAQQAARLLTLVSRTLLPGNLPRLATRAWRAAAKQSSLARAMAGVWAALGGSGSGREAAASLAPSGCSAPPSSACHALLLFCQLLFSFLAPCYVLWRQELASRRHFLAAAAAVNPDARAERLPKASWCQLIWQAPLAVAACWQVAEVGAGYAAPAATR